ncbi:hypothetical protein [Streptosporangium roseum]|uniref:hypothetical protein n=1 Tax=Streptosporangium roseum TaxID=2001 RepID=UPI00332DAE6B
MAASSRAVTAQRRSTSQLSSESGALPAASSRSASAVPASSKAVRSGWRRRTGQSPRRSSVISRPPAAVIAMPDAQRSRTRTPGTS